jgi:hypothetical protein
MLLLLEVKLLHSVMDKIKRTFLLICYKMGSEIFTHMFCIRCRSHRA